MPRFAAWAVITPAGDAAATLTALINGTARPGRLEAELLATLVRLARQVLATVQPDLILLATTKGDLPRWCAAICAAEPQLDGGPADLAAALQKELGVTTYALGAACASGPMALGEAARMLLAGEARRILVLGGDRLGPFVEDGFTALKAVDPQGCHPFDANRAGISLGETAAAVLLDLEPGAIRLQGWGASLDAAHLTAPARDGAGLAACCRQTLARGQTKNPGLIIAHGTGTRANDDAESLAYHQVCPGVPVTAWKAGLGHSLGACGLTEVALMAEALAHDRAVPGTLGLVEAHIPAPLALLPPGEHRCAGPWLSPNAGFGGINAAVLLGSGEPLPLSPSSARLTARVSVDHLGWQSTPSEINGTWENSAPAGHLPRPISRQVLGQLDPTWGRLDGASRLLVHLGRVLGPWPADTAIVLLSTRGCLESDLRFERSRQAKAIDRQAFAYTLPSAPVGEASIRLGLHGTGFVILGAADDAGRRSARRLLSEGAPAVLLARIETGGTDSEIAWGERWEG